MLEQERQRIEQLTAGWDDPTQVDWGTEENAEEGEGLVRQEAAPSAPLLKCTALYSYTAQNPDELTIVENEQLEVDVISTVKALTELKSNMISEREQSVTTPGLQTQISFSSVDYTVDNEEESAQQATETTQSPEQISVISIPQKTPDGTNPEYCIALYDYEGEGGEELTFEEGQIIKILSRCAHSIDDGWWQGELEGHIGNFPSLVVEECDEFGEPLVNEWDETPPQSAPPVFTPPDVPDYLADTEEGDEVTISSPPLQPPPPAPPIEDEDEAINENGEIPEEGEVEAEDGEDAAALGGFAMSLSRDQQHHYGSQFNRSSGAPTAVPIDQEDQQADSDFGLCAAQIVITAATPMMEEAASPFPPPEESEVNHKDGGKDPSSIPEEDEEDSKPPPSHPPVSSSTGSDGETTGPSTAENSVSQAPPATEPETKQVVGGRASIPDELEPHQLARLQDLKESNA
ncbi:unnamed protein product [Diabrotica balteata]|uniref:SH3 domain-containing protein n=1 Tax=Diabrotica balteata TaxID=107213 RepID=A0A9N9TCJ7_DIABA|nr:unnamed protein product [Diabrotica balteata]